MILDIESWKEDHASDYLLVINLHTMVKFEQCYY